jgi:DNA-binding LacI/PurR family transcriptional regulator
MKRPTIGDIARRAGVSKAAVSYALNGRPGVSEETRDRVSKIAHALGWRANTAALALSGERVGVVGLVLAGPASWPMVEGIERELAGEGIALQLAIVSDVEAELETYREWWATRRVDGVLLIDPRSEDPRIPLLCSLKMPAAVVGLSVPGLSAVQEDSAAVCRQVVGHLAEGGHRRVGYVTKSDRSCRDTERVRVLRELLGAALVEAKAVPELLELPDPPTAVIYEDDLTAAATVANAAQLGVRIPDELAIVACNDSPVCQLVNVTAVRRDDGADGASAARLLLKQLDTGVPEHGASSPGELMIRGTT